MNTIILRSPGYAKYKLGTHRLMTQKVNVTNDYAGFLEKNRTPIILMKDKLEYCEKEKAFPWMSKQVSIKNGDIDCSMYIKLQENQSFPDISFLSLV